MRVCSLCLLLLACGAPPPVAPTGPQSLAELASSKPLAVAGEKVLEVAFAGATLPGVDAVEAALAKAAIVAEVGDGSSGLDVGMPGADCTVTEAPRGTLPSPVIAPEYEKHGLDEAAARALDKATRRARVLCKGDTANNRLAVVAADRLATALVAVTGGGLYDPQIDRHWPKAAWDGHGKRFAVARSVRVIKEAGDDGRFWVGTRGMIALGRPDLEVFPVPAEHVEALSGALLAIVDGLVDEASVGYGSVLELGPVRPLLMERGAYADTLPKGTTGASVQVEGPTLGRAALVDGAAKPGDVAAAERMARRLAVR